MVLVGVSAIVFPAAIFRRAAIEGTRGRGDVKRRPRQKLTVAVSESLMYRSCSCVAAEYNGIFGSTARDSIGLQDLAAPFRGVASHHLEFVCHSVARAFLAPY